MKKKNKLRKIQVIPLNKIVNSNGDVLKILAKNNSGYKGFGEAYFSNVKWGSIKAWKLHTKMTMNLIVPVGNVKFVFIEKNQNGTLEYLVEEIGEKNYSRIVVPPGIWFGFIGTAKSQNLILNIANIKHNPKEIQRLPVDAFDFNWI
jgi:dTDP-4-dehydrorhamnose 3,5-epimerase